MQKTPRLKARLLACGPPPGITCWQVRTPDGRPQTLCVTPQACGSRACPQLRWDVIYVPQIGHSASACTVAAAPKRSQAFHVTCAALPLPLLLIYKPPRHQLWAVQHHGYVCPEMSCGAKPGSTWSGAQQPASSRAAGILCVRCHVALGAPAQLIACVCLSRPQCPRPSIPRQDRR